ncbi:Uncharacterised protein [Listeria ivanovii subsp. londoniensis]|uniref:Uncharacterized protein n=2 Tax=Listeria ivanovii TaxID=1638 RepID=A0ABS1G8G6_LISIV|nr:hypothetical protein [Listeria ivanovii]AIS60064.1 hypothetical protein JL58_08680 [Listeria ivanovii subsp. londoniensis]MBK1963153.1 hypothetical protein [Listeria ivanovii subsp. londoniensis]SDW87177.1 hypothetical protein SAMN05421782_107147 [Listeria ivanovii]VEH46846.1 Uncharacterised protein [Listeria ivanovii subsp. londoniensis]
MKIFLTKIQHQLNQQVKFIFSTIATLLVIIMGSYIIGLTLLMIIITLLEKIPLLTKEPSISFTYFLNFFLCFILILITFIISRSVLKKYFFKYSIELFTKEDIKTKYDIFPLASFCMENLEVIKRQISHSSLIFALLGATILAVSINPNKIGEMFNDSTSSLVLAFPLAIIHINYFLSQPKHKIEQSYQKALYKKFSKFFD